MGENMLTHLREMLEAARKNGYQETAKAITTIIGDFQRINKDYIDKKELLAYIKSQYKSAEKASNQASKVGLTFKIDYHYFEVLNDLEEMFALPELTEVQIRQYFAELTKLNPNMNKGLLMKAIKEEFPGRYDGKLAAQIAGEFHTNK